MSLHTRAPMWMRNVVFTSLGRKTVGGRQTTKMAIKIFVPRKLPKSQLLAEERIPINVGGLATDVVALSDSSVSASMASPSSGESQIGSGASIVTDAGLTGTMACIVQDSAGHHYGVTASHVTQSKGQLVSERASDGEVRAIGTVAGGLGVLLGSRVYPDKPELAQTKIMADVGVIRLIPGQEAVGGTSDGRKFLLSGKVYEMASGLLDQARVFSIDPETRAVAHGVFQSAHVVVDIPGLGPTMFLGQILQETDSHGGSSGRLWCAETTKEPILLGLHWGLRVEGQRLALVTDLLPSLQVAKVSRIATKPGTFVVN